MNNLCARHVLCPPGTGAESSEANYSSEHVDVPEYYGEYYPPVTPYGYYTACQGRCLSLVSQSDADLCAQRLAKLCYNDAVPTGPGGRPKPVVGNDPQTCNEPGTGRLVAVPANVFYADSLAEANKQALAYANSLQKNPRTPPGTTIIPPPSTPVTTPTNPIPTPVTPPAPKPPAPPASQCKPCDDTSAVSTFTLPCNVPADCAFKAFESPPLKCGQWRFEVITNNPGSVDDGESYITAQVVAGDPLRTPVDWGSFEDCPQMAWINPCSPADCSAPRTDLAWGFYPGCCADTDSDCRYLRCQTLDDGTHWMPLLMIYYTSIFNIGNSAKQFTVKGTLLAPLPP